MKILDYTGTGASAAVEANVSSTPVTTEQRLMQVEFTPGSGTQRFGLKVWIRLAGASMWAPWLAVNEFDLGPPTGAAASGVFHLPPATHVRVQVVASSHASNNVKVFVE